MPLEQLRKTRSIVEVELVEPLKTDEHFTTLSGPRLVDSEGLLIVGLKNRFNDDTSAQMPAQWEAFQPHIGSIHGQKSNAAYDVL